MRHLAVSAVLLVVTLAATPCCGLTTGARGSSEPVPSAPSAAPRATTVYIENEPATLRINNYSRLPIYHVYLSPSEASVWGGDQLGSRVLSIGSTLTIPDVPPGFWDLRVVDSHGNFRDWRLERLASGRTYTADVTGANWSRPERTTRVSSRAL